MDYTLYISILKQNFSKYKSLWQWFVNFLSNTKAFSFTDSQNHKKKTNKLINCSQNLLLANKLQLPTIKFKIILKSYLHKPNIILLVNHQQQLCTHQLNTIIRNISSLIFFRILSNTSVIMLQFHCTLILFDF